MKCEKMKTVSNFETAKSTVNVGESLLSSSASAANTKQEEIFLRKIKRLKKNHKNNFNFPKMKNSEMVDCLQALSKKINLMQEYISLKFGSDFKEFCQEKEVVENRPIVKVTMPPNYVEIMDDEDTNDVVQRLQSPLTFLKHESIEISAESQAEDDQNSEEEHINKDDVDGNADLSNFSTLKSSEGRYLCLDAKCASTFSFKGDAQRHWKSVHLRQRPFVCAICKKGFQHKFHLKRHNARTCRPDEPKSKSSPSKSKSVSSSTRSSNSGDQSNENFSDEYQKLKYVCQQCDKRFKTSWMLKRHDLTHEKEREKRNKGSKK